MTEQQRYIAAFGRKMMDLARHHDNDKISNELSRVGNQLAEKASLKDLTELDKKVIQFAKQIGA